MANKMFAVFAAVLMVAVVGAAMVNVSDDSEATADLTTTAKVYFKGPADTQIRSETVYAYDLYQAVVTAGSSLGYTVTTASGNDTWNKLEAGGYYNPNEDYGTLSTITVTDGSAVDISNYTVYVYNKTLTNPTYGWNPALDAIGWYHPFDDYRALYQAPSPTGMAYYSLASANIAIIYGEGAPTSGMIDLVEVERYDSNFQYMFHIEDAKKVTNISRVNVIVWDDTQQVFKESKLTPSKLKNGGMDIYGWGSNAFEALVDALGATYVLGQLDYNLVHDMGTYTYDTYYSWLNNILGYDTVTTDNGDGTKTYDYWSTYSGPSSADYCLYTLGYYSSLSGAQNAGDSFRVIYETSTY